MTLLTMNGFIVCLVQFVADGWIKRKLHRTVLFIFHDASRVPNVYSHTYIVCVMSVWDELYTDNDMYTVYTGQQCSGRQLRLGTPVAPELRTWHQSSGGGWIVMAMVRDVNTGTWSLVNILWHEWGAWAGGDWHWHQSSRPPSWCLSSAKCRLC